MKKILSLALLVALCSGDDIHGVQREVIRNVNLSPQRLGLIYAIRLEARGTRLTDYRLRSLPDDVRKACLMLRAINSKGFLDLSPVERAVSSFLNWQGGAHCMIVGRYPESSPLDCSDDDISTMSIIFLISEVAPKGLLIIDSAASRILASLIRKYPEFLGYLGSAKVIMMLDDNLPLQVEETDALKHIAYRIKEFQIVNPIGTTGTGRKVITEGVANLLGESVENGCLEQISFDVNNCVDDKIGQKMLGLASIRSSGKIAKTNPDNAADLLKTGNGGNVVIKWEPRQ